VKRLFRLLSEIHRRFIWQAFAIYLLVAFVAYHVSVQIAQTRDLPDWFILVAVVLRPQPSCRRGSQPSDDPTRAYA
jgi:hypothetical protein